MNGWLRAVAAICVLLVAGARAGAPVESPKPDEVLKTLRPGHPRLVLLNDDLARLKETIAADKTAQGYYESIRKQADESLKAKPVQHVLIGPRLLSQSRTCLHRVMLWSLMYRLDGDKRYAQRAKEELLAAAAFPDWNPSHFLDTAEMSHAFAIGYDWLYDYLTPDERARLRTALVEKGLRPALKIYREDGWWAKSEANWNQVCNGGITIGALAIADEETSLAQELLASGLRSIPRAMASYAPDGGWAEGPGYWHYATRYNVYYLAALESVLGTDFGLSQMDGFDDAGLFRVYFCGPIGRTFNYADAGDRAGSAAEMFWLARKFDRPVYAAHERLMLTRNATPDPWHLVWYDPRGRGPKAENLALDRYFRGVDVAFFRDRWQNRNAIFVGFKGGDNKANHSHLDLGSFVLDAFGHRWAVDLGPDNYDLPGYFGNQRWTYFRLRTESHNTLVLNGENQDPRAAAPIVAFASKPERAYAVEDLSEAYAKGARRVRRGLALLDRRHVLVQDEIDGLMPGEVVWAMLTPAKVEIQGAKATLALEKERLAMQIVEPAGAVFATLPANPPKPQAQQPDVTKLVVNLPRRVTSTRIAVRLTPYHEGEQPPVWKGKIEPLEKWIEAAK
jgi:hypothetical protein